jgi:RNA polymerase sigma-B factor
MPNPSSVPIQMRNQRVAEHLSLVHSVARHYAACTRERRDDLQQVAALGLIRAAERYDSSTHVPFAAFAGPHIRGAVLHYLRDVAPLLRISRRLQERSRALRHCRLALESATGREPTNADAYTALGRIVVVGERVALPDGRMMGQRELSLEALRHDPARADAYRR